MRWEFRIGSRTYYVQWADGAITTDNVLADVEIGFMVAEGVIVPYGPVGPFIVSSLETEMDAFATIEFALGQIAAEVVSAPEPPVDFEAGLRQN
jgi:hypothetical protein